MRKRIEYAIGRSLLPGWTKVVAFIAAAMLANAGKPPMEFTGMELMPVMRDADGNALGRPQIKLLGTGFPVGQPGNLCVVLPNPELQGPNGEVPSFPMTVVGVPTDDCIIIEVPPLPPGMPPAPLQVLAGDGMRDRWDPAFQDVRPLLPASSFAGQGEPILTPDPLDVAGLPRPPVQPPNVRWFFSEIGPDGDLCLTLSGDWGNPSIVDLAGDITVLVDPASGLKWTFELRSEFNLLTANGSLQECAERIRDMIICILQQQLRLPPGTIQVNVVPLGDGEIKLQIFINDPDSPTGAVLPLCGGGFRLCVTRPWKPPVVDGYRVSTIGPNGRPIIREGTIIKIVGSGFGQNASDVVVQLCTEPVPTTLEVIMVADDCVIAKVGSLPRDGKIGPLKVFCGRGGTNAWVSGLRDVQPESPGQLTLTPIDQGLPPLEFDLPNTPPLPPDAQLLPILNPSRLLIPERVTYIEPYIEEGRIYFDLDVAWGSRPSVSIFGTLGISEIGSSGGTGISGYFHVDRTRLTGAGDGTPLECANRIADIFRCALGVFDVTVDTSTGVPRVCMAIPGYEVTVLGEESQLCLFRPFLLQPDLAGLRNLTPGPIRPGSLVEIGAKPLPQDPDDLCSMFGDVPVHIIQEIGGNLIGAVGAMSPGDQMGPFVMESGRGNRARILLPFREAEVMPLQLPEVWVGDGIPPTGALPELPNLPGPDAPDNVEYFESEPLTGPSSEVCIFISGVWCPGATVRFEGHIGKIQADGTITGYDWNVPDIRFSQGGDIEHCVRRLKDLPLCATDQLSLARQSLTWDCIPIDSEPQDGIIDTVKLVVKCPFGSQFVPGSHLLVCLDNPPKDPLKIVSVNTVTGESPVCVRECDILCIEVCNAGCDPKALCAMIGAGADQAIPLRVVEIIKGPVAGGVDKVIVQVGSIPPGAVPAPVCLIRGRGNAGVWQPGLVGATGAPSTAPVTREGCVFESLGRPAVYSDTLVWPKPDPPTDPCFPGHPDDNNSAICVDIVGGPWAPGSNIKVTGHIRVINAAGIADGVDLQNPIMRPLAGQTAVDVADVLKDVWRCQLAQLAQITNIQLKCPDDGDNDPNTAIFKICPDPGATIHGWIRVYVCEPALEPRLKPDQTFPPVCPGDIVCIYVLDVPPGNPDKFCVVAGDGTNGFRLEVLDASLTPDPTDDPNCVKLTCQVGEFDSRVLQEGAILNLYIGCFDGKRTGAVFNVPGALGDFAPWTASNAVDNPILCVPDAIEVGPPKLPPPDERWFHAVRGPDGEICITIPAGVVWAPQQNVSINGHLTLPPPWGDIDLHQKRVRLRDGGTPEQCAAAIKDVLRCVFAELDGFEFVVIKCDVDPATGEIKITLCWPDPGVPFGQPTFLTICLIDPAPTPTIEPGPPVDFAAGTPLRIRGKGFGNDPDDLCVVVRMPDGRRLGTRVVSAADDQIEVMPRVIPPDVAGEGRFEVMRGRGVVGEPLFVVPGIEPGERPVWNWEGNNPEAKAMGPPNVTPVPTPPPPVEKWFFAELVQGKLCVTISGDWPADSEVRITARAHNECQRLDLDGPSSRFIGGGSAEECAAKIKDFLLCAFRQQTGAVVVVTCDPSPAANAVKITIELEGGKDIDWGLCTICVVEGTSTAGDADNDGLPDREDPDPNNPDSDGDGLLDGDEAFGPDGQPNTGDETDPLNPDSDGDGCSDGDEINHFGTDPNDASDCLKLEIVDVDPASGTATLLIPETVPFTAYTIRVSPDLVTPFSPHPGEVALHPLVPGDPLQRNVFLPGQFPPKVFFDVFAFRP